jgi:hypothetical protein
LERKEKKSAFFSWRLETKKTPVDGLKRGRFKTPLDSISLEKEQTTIMGRGSPL